jgi:hypothetical protein
MRGIICMHLEQYSEAVAHFRQAAALGSQEAAANLEMARQIINLAVIE